MPKAMRKSGKTSNSAKRRAPQPATQKQEDATPQQSDQPLGELVQHARQAPQTLTQRDVLQLQRAVGNQAVAQMLTVQRREIDSAGKDIVQRVGGEEDEKKKGEDYCNNIGKSIANIDTLLPGFSNEAIKAAIATINENRPHCAVSTSLVTGPDTNTEAYSGFVVHLNEIAQQIKNLLEETDLKYAQEQVKGFGTDLMSLLDTIPTVAVDDRVAKVITDGEEGDKKALDKINKALGDLKTALKARFKEFIMLLLATIKSKAKKPEDTK